LDKASPDPVKIHQIRPKPEFSWVDPANLAETWDKIRNGLDLVWAHGDHWLVEDVYTAIKTGGAHLHLATVGGCYAGFVIAQPQQAPDGAILHLWALYAVDGNREHFIDWLAQIDEWARQIKAKRITFHSPRKGWEKLGQKLGFEYRMAIFERAVT